jgi:hypothetical protein
MKKYTLRVHVVTKYGQQHSSTVQYLAHNWQQATTKAKKFATSAYGYNNITQVEIEGIK